MRTWTLYGALALALPVWMVGCTGSMDDPIPGKPDEQGTAAEKDSPGKADAWNYRNNPAGLRVDLKYKLAELHGNGQDQNLAKDTNNPPWPDTYWPTYMDSYNHRWQDTGDFIQDLSPAEKYDAAFNGWDPNAVQELRPFDGNDCSDGSFDKSYYDNLGPAAQYTSYYKGNRATREAAVAGKLTDRCSADPEGSCVKACENDDNRERCERRCDRGGVETWWGLCHAWAPAAVIEKEPLYPVTIDGITFEVGDIKALYSSIYDRSSASLIGGRCNDFEVERDETTGRISNDDCRDLNAGSFHVAVVNLIGLQGRGFIEDRTWDYEVWNQPIKGYSISKFEEIDVAQAHRLLKVDADDPTTLEKCVRGTNVERGDYCYNGRAHTLYNVHLRLNWITESHASTVAEGAENLARYTRADSYTYIVEVDRSGAVIGGEWYGRSVAAHPDFVWVPFQAHGGNPSIDVEKVRMLGRLSQNPPAPAGPMEDVLSYTSGGGPVAIPDRNPTGASSVIAVGDGAEVQSMTVGVDITHTYIGDLVITLTSPKGQTWRLHNKEGGSTDNLNKVYEFDDIEGPINGAWKLHVVDVYSRDIGTIDAWKLDFQVGEPSAQEVSAVTYRVSPSKTIPDNRADGIASAFNVDQPGAIAKLEVTVDITHTYIGDLVVELSKAGTTKVLHAREGGSDDDLQKTWTVREFNGAEAGGKWTLKVQDLARLDLGTLEQWSVRITY